MEKSTCYKSCWGEKIMKKEEIVRMHIEEIIDNVAIEVSFCGCYEGDIRDYFPKAKQELTDRLVKMFNKLELLSD